MWCCGATCAIAPGDVPPVVYLVDVSAISGDGSVDGCVDGGVAPPPFKHYIHTCNEASECC